MPNWRQGGPVHVGIMATNTYPAVIEREGDAYVALCPELDIASQGTTIEEAKANLNEAVELFLESADPEEIRRRFHGEISSRGSKHRNG